MQKPDRKEVKNEYKKIKHKNKKVILSSNYLKGFIFKVLKDLFSKQFAKVVNKMNAFQKIR